MSEPFLESLRYDYNLTPESIVLDCGGYEGRFAETMVNKYGCTVYVFEPIHRFHEALVEKFKGNPKIKLFNHGVAGTNRVDWFCIKGDMTGKFADTGDEQVVWLRDIATVIAEIGKPIALLKLNIEGLEYEALEGLMDSVCWRAVQNIQVQCHGTPGFERYEAIRTRLLETHELTFDFPFVWQNFRQKREACGIDSPTRVSHSQAGQDTFARETIGGCGYFLDIGCSDPTHISNTAVLEAIGWTGVRMDVAAVPESDRKSPVILCDAAKADWPKLISDNIVFPVVDYLSLDIDGGTLQALRNLLPHVRFKVATVEHDYYRLGHGMKDDIRHEMKMAGYSLLCANVCHEGLPFEDWWIDEAYFKPKVAVEVVHEFTPDTYFDKILVINLERRPDRWEHCLAEFKKHGVAKYERFVAYDFPNDGHRGCTESHRGVLEIISHNQWKRVLVLEDDFEIVHENFGNLFSAAIADVESKAPDWEMLYLGGGYGSAPQERLSPHVIRVDTMMTTSSYGITWQQARKMAPHISGSGQIDGLYGAFTRADKCYCIQPRLMVQYANYSDLSKVDSNNRSSMLDPAHEKLV